MRIPTAALLFLFIFSESIGQTRTEVPHKLQFADMTLTIRDDARREIQKDVDALTQSPRHFNIKAERAKTYFPIIEKVFREEGVPDDFKYLVLQESALIADAVSVSNAVGFWQFKDFTAVEMGLRVDKEIDERLNIVSSSRAAARYLKKNNVFFNNWLYALQAYQMGAGGVLRSVKESQSGQRHMEITSRTYWYVKKYLAHKIAFDGAVSGAGAIQVVTYDTQSRKTLSDVAREVSVEEAELRTYNKWTKSGNIPDDRSYAVLIPITDKTKTVTLPATAVASRVPETKSGNVPGSAAAARKDERKKVNGILTVRAEEGDTPAKLASRAGVDLPMFLKWNDMTAGDKTAPGKLYLLGKKRSRATEAYHKVAAGETLWDVGQTYGVQLKKLRRYNRMGSDEQIEPGMTLWLASTRPKGSDKMEVANEVVEVSKGDTFAWTADPNAMPAVISETTASTEPVLIAPVVEAAPEERDSVEVMVKDSIKAVTTDVTAPDTTIAEIPAEPAEIVVVPEKKGTHVVVAGETLYAIARQYNVGVMDLVTWNNLNLQDGIRPGQVLQLSSNQSVNEEETSTPGKAVEIQHEVKPTDTLYSIARKYNVTIKDLMAWNNKKDFALAVGEKLKVIQK